MGHAGYRRPWLSGYHRLGLHPVAEVAPYQGGITGPVSGTGMMAGMTPDAETRPKGHPCKNAAEQGVAGGSHATFSLREAADVAGVSVSTMRRRKAALQEAGAIISDTGWQVPMTALIAVGLIAGEGTGPERTEDQPGKDSGTVRLHERIAELEHQVSELRHRAETAEAIAAERQQTVDVLRVANETERMALRMLTSGKTSASEQTENEDRRADPPRPSPVQEAPAPAKPGVWRRVFGGVR